VGFSAVPRRVQNHSAYLLLKEPFCFPYHQPIKSIIKQPDFDIIPDLHIFSSITKIIIPPDSQIL
jgi:hypothetical protein